MQEHIISHRHDRQWWKEATIYQIYPSSFYDSNNDGIGDIPGVILKLPYLASLGIDGIWLSPHYASPQIDMGYDISDFEDIYPPYGTLQDCQTLIDDCHKYGIKIMFDLVINHTSDQHAWFQESRSSLTNSKRDWYIWKPPRGWYANGTPLPPNNWRSNFSIPAWTFDPLTKQYYLHLYASEMPDLNWENSECRQAIYETSMHFWLRRGIDGFRIDTVNKYSKSQDFPDAPITDSIQYTQPAQALYSNGPRMHEFLSEMHDVLSQYSAHAGSTTTTVAKKNPIMTVGELPNTPKIEDVETYVSASARQMDIVFNFDTVQLGQKTGDRLVHQPYTVSDVKRTLSTWQEFVTGKDVWTTVFMENHDQGRCVSRFGDDSTEELRVKSAKLWAIVLGTMTGTLFLYQGQEIGMVNIPKDWPLEEYKDVRSVNHVKAMKERGASEEELNIARRNMAIAARDNARLPVQWDNGPNAGFNTGAKPWMRVHDAYKNLNVMQQEHDKNSVLSFWKRILQLRKQERDPPLKDMFVYGTFEYVETDEDAIFMFLKRSEEGQKRVMTVTVANLGGEKKRFTMPSEGAWKLVLANVDDTVEDAELTPWEARVYRLDTSG